MSEEQEQIVAAKPWLLKGKRDLLTAEQLLVIGVEGVLDVERSAART